MPGMIYTRPRGHFPSPLLRPAPSTPSFYNKRNIYSNAFEMSLSSLVQFSHLIVFRLLIWSGIITVSISIRRWAHLFYPSQLSISAWLTSQFNKHGHQNGITQRDRVRYVLFASMWTVVFCTFYLVLFLYSTTGSVLTSIASHLIFLFLTWVIWIAAAAAVTQMLGGGLNCKTQDVFVYCGQLNALEAFCWIEWILVTLAVFIMIFQAFRPAVKVTAEEVL
ncbi:uncharacterized protein EV420DRAFT_811477 [Desarmillaria tabescens]|uniref:MARVEL domain-containing protein n=1 Tax=Armillaria tabescens TaxID=1929756 RepID=A0AA39TXL5_ARMTA|nr:uncharacterized protein EV420DRAFT_811477 [Desarmillaria tabescens]KAK0466139.1 hypothetical protein EV420DRAFT_811477 [Desarmillaria tabescens]